MKTNQFQVASMFSFPGWMFVTLIRPPSAFLRQSSLLVLFLSVLPAAVQAQFAYTTNNGALSSAILSGSNTVFDPPEVADDADTATNVDSSLVDAASNSPSQFQLPFTNGSSGLHLRTQVNERADPRFQSEAENGISYLLAPQIRTEAGNKPVISYDPGLEPRIQTPINVVQSKKYPGVEYSGILVQAAKSNPLQLINPFAPAIYGDGEANIVRNLFTREVAGLKFWQISF